MKEFLKQAEFPYGLENRNNPVHAEYFADAGQEYINPPVNSLDPEQINTANAYDMVAEDYFGKMTPERRDHISTLVEELEASQEKQILTNPEIIVCIPVAAHNEDPKTLDKMFSVLAESDNIEQTEIFLFGNHPDVLNDEAVVAANDNIRTAVDRARTKFPDLQIKYLTVGFEESTMGMGAVRKEMMDVIAADALMRGLAYDQPVTWVDADLTRMDKSALMDLSAAVKNDPSAFMQHLNQQRTLEGVTPAKLGSASPEEKLAVHYEISRRRLTREAMKADPSLRKAYIEEWGLGFMMGNYLLVGGVNNQDPVNETSWIGTGFVSFWENAGRIMAKATGRDTIAKNLPTAVVNYIPGSHIFTSGRRLVDTARTLINDFEDNQHYDHYDLADQYGTDLFSHTDELRSKKLESAGGISDRSEATVKEIVRKLIPYNARALTEGRDKIDDREVRLRARLIK